MNNSKISQIIKEYATSGIHNAKLALENIQNDIGKFNAWYTFSTYILIETTVKEILVKLYGLQELINLEERKKIDPTSDGDMSWSKHGEGKVRIDSKINQTIGGQKEK